ncbi:NAD(P)-binding protein [Ceraceosorus guamensis]|uniref:NAD(P)-binding protein n=1 Tax=Ceraceosorus guamensis TaxID=1522189 RepID=A0A316VUA3_9BASI|nr:NAD(P)-binding protein [Ceraceosorus guamensis]PWN41206.1 NAD(P)-binding protein [Ceraceosorus guamensis]
MSFAPSPFQEDERPVIVITGCSSGIGAALVKEFSSAETHRVVATARNLESLRFLPSNVWRVQLDVTSQSSVDRAIHDIIKELGRIDMLVNNAGTNTAVGASVEVSLERYRQTFDANYFGLIRVTQAVTPHMIKARSGTVVNVGSVAGLSPLPFAAAYASSKAAVHAFSDCLRSELAGFGIKVIVVAPGAIQSSIGDAGAKGISVADSSPYKNVEDMIQYRAMYSQIGRNTPAHVFAKNIRRAVTKKNPRAYILSGARTTVAFLLWLMPARWRDFLLSFVFQTYRIGRTA